MGADGDNTIRSKKEVVEYLLSAVKRYLVRMFHELLGFIIIYCD